MDPLLEIRDLKVEIPIAGGVVHALNRASLSVESGAAVGVVGESGSGKSMLLRAVLGLLPPRARITGGEIRFEGRDLVAASEPARRRLRGTSVAMVFQEPMSALNPVVPVGRQIAEGPAVRLGRTRAQARRRAIELMTLVSIPDAARRMDAYPHELSGGMRQRVMIAMALSCEPRLLLCDEPTTALDVTIQDQILRLLVDLRAQMGLTVVFVTHDLAVVSQVCEQLAVMYAGQVIEAGGAGDVFREARHPYTLGLLRSMPTVKALRGRLDAIPGAPPDLSELPSGCPFYARCALSRSDCADGEFPLRSLPSGRQTACIHHDACAEDQARSGAETHV